MYDFSLVAMGDGREELGHDFCRLILRKGLLFQDCLE
jgi:hypothetical protein